MNNEATQAANELLLTESDHGYLQQFEISNDELMLKLDFMCQVSFNDEFYVFIDDSCIVRSGDEYTIVNDFYSIFGEE